jgi:hypothetical protein
MSIQTRIGRECMDRGVQGRLGDAEVSSVQAHLSDNRPGFWPILAAVFVAGWIGGGAGALLWAVIGCCALVDVLIGVRPVLRRAV